VGLGGFEPPTSPLSGVRSNQLSYRPVYRPQGFKPALYLLGTHVICVSAHLSSKTSFKEVIQPQVPLRLPCYDLTPVMNHTVVSDPPKVSLPTSGTAHSHGLTGGVYKA
jgi:hypothetical protein